MTPFHLRDRLKRLLARGGEPSTPDPVHPAPSARVVPAPPPATREVGPAEPAAPATAPAGPAASAPTAPVPAASTAPAPAAPAAPAPAGPEADARSEADKQKEAERQARHWARTRKGMLRWLAEHDGDAPMADMHAHSEAKYFVAHRAFSRLMEEFTAEGLVDYGSGRVILTDAGRAALDG